MHSLDLVGVYATDADTVNLVLLIETLEAEAKKQLKILSEELNQAGIQNETILLEGTELNWLAHELTKSKPDLIIMGTTGAGHVENKLFGSLTYKVISDTELPILAVPYKAKFNDFKSIVYATDYKTTDLQNLQTLIDWMQTFDSKIDFAHIANSDFSVEEERAFFKDFSENINTALDYPNIKAHLLFSEDVEDRLTRLLEEQAADLLVLVTKKRNFFERIFSKSLTKKMAYHNDTPLLIFKVK